MDKDLGKNTGALNLSDLSDEIKGEILGVFAGDGNFFFDQKRYKYTIRFFFNKSESKYAQDLCDLMGMALGKPPNFRKEKNRSIITLTYLSKPFYLFLKSHLSWKTTENKKKSHTIRLKKVNQPREFKIGFLRGNIDTDGCISEKRINFASTSKNLIRNIEQFIKDLGFTNYNRWSYDDKRGKRSRIHHIDLNRPEIKRFLRVVNPRNRNF